MIRTAKRTAPVIPALLLALAPLSAQELPVVPPESVGLSSERLDHLDRAIDRHIEEGRLAGVVTLVARGGRVAYLRAAGMQDREAGIPMDERTIFRIASMSKPITSVAVMVLYEEGHFRLDDPVADYLPAFEDMRVLADADTSLPLADRATVPADRPITIRHLLTHTSGLAYQWNPTLGDAYADAGITHGLVSDPDPLSADIPRLASLPLLHHPGERLTYGLSVDVLGYLVETVSGRPLPEFLRERIFEPLGMHDTQFKVAEDQAARLSAAYTITEDGSLRQLGEETVHGSGTIYSAGYPTDDEHRYFSGGAGLTSTVPDYFRFARMLLNGGELDGVRILSPKTVELMTTDHVGDLLGTTGFGLGVYVTRSLSESGELGTPGTFGWGSFWYGTFFVDPVEAMIGISIANLHPSGDATLHSRFGILARQAIVK